MNEVVRSKVRIAIERYGRIGLLIDDSPRANHRVAREMYGAESLPDWWVIARSQRCARQALEALADLQPTPAIPSLILADRYLPEKCDDQNEKPWSDEHLSGLAAAVRARHVAYFSSYPYSSDGDRPARLAWQPRDSETIVTLRRVIEKEAESDRSQRSLLRFAPPDWQRPIDDLAKELSSRSSRVVLLTGAGVSVAESDFSPGMPLTEYLLSSVLSEILGVGKRVLAPLFPVSPECCCKQSTVDENLPPPTLRSPHQAPLERAQQELEVYGRLGQDWWHLTELVDPELNRDFADEVAELLPELNRSMLRYDRDFPGAHWYFAHLPWERIVTTNFDTFHERASQQAVTLWNGLPALRPTPGLGYSDKGVVSNMASAQKLDTEPLLRKPYGSLAHPEILAWTDKDLANSEAKFAAAFPATGPIWLVVVGHSVRDPWIASWIRSNVRSGQIGELFWVDKQAKRQRAKSASDWDALLVEGRVTCLEGRALEFAHDLYMKWLRKQTKGANQPRQ